MANTGNKQAVISYAVRSTDGAPLDIYGKPISESGRKQAIALLQGAANPNPVLFEVQFYYLPDAIINGTPTVIFSPEDCAVGFIAVTPARFVFSPTSTQHSAVVTSSSDWELTGVDASIAGIFNITPDSGIRGITDILITLANPALEGQGYATFTNTATGDVFKLRLIHALTSPWILEDGTWNMLGFWYNNGIWNY